MNGIQNEQIEKNLILSQRVTSGLKAKGLYITAVESCTGGALADMITNTPGASDVMKDSFITYSNEAKIALGIPKEVIDTYTVYSNEVAMAMAEAGLRKSITASVSIGIMGSISRLDPSNPNSQPGHIYFAIKYEDNAVNKELVVAEDIRFNVKQRVVTEVLLEILKLL